MSISDVGGVLRRQPIRTICVLIAILSAAGIYWLDGKIEKAALDLDQKTAEGARLATNVSYAAQLPAQLAKLSNAGQRVKERLVHATELATNLQYFYRLEKDSGVELVELHQTTSSDGAKSKAKGSGVMFSISVKGDYPALITWLRRLESGTHYCRILSTSMGLVGIDRTGPVTLNITLELLGES